MRRLVTGPGFLDSGGSLGTPPEYAMGVEVARDQSWSPCSPCPALCDPTRRGKGYNCRSRSSSHAPPEQWCLASKATQASSAYTLGCSCTGFQPHPPGCFHTINPSFLPGSDIRSLNFSTHSPLPG